MPASILIRVKIHFVNAKIHYKFDRQYLHSIYLKQFEEQIEFINSQVGQSRLELGNPF